MGLFSKTPQQRYVKLVKKKRKLIRLLKEVTLVYTDKGTSEGEKEAAMKAGIKYNRSFEIVSEQINGRYILVEKEESAIVAGAKCCDCRLTGYYETPEFWEE